MHIIWLLLCFALVFTAVCDLVADLCLHVMSIWWKWLLHLKRNRKLFKCPALWLCLILSILSGGPYWLLLNLVDLLMTSPDQTRIKVLGLTVAVATVIGEACPCNCNDISSLFLWPFCSVGINPVLTLIKCVCRPTTLTEICPVGLRDEEQHCLRFEISWYEWSPWTVLCCFSSFFPSLFFVHFSPFGFTCSSRKLPAEGNPWLRLTAFSSLQGSDSPRVLDCCINYAISDEEITSCGSLRTCVLALKLSNGGVKVVACLSQEHRIREPADQEVKKDPINDFWLY